MPAAEVLINATNQSMDSWDQSPSATIIEIKLIEWLRAQVGYPAGDAGVFTSGGTQSNLMGLMLARDAYARQGHSVQQHGITGDLRKIKVLCSENAHFSVQKNMALLGHGYQSVVQVKSDQFARMDVNDLKAKLAQAEANGEQIRRSSRRQVLPMPVPSIRCVKSQPSPLSTTSGCTWMRLARCCCLKSIVITGWSGAGGFRHPRLPQTILPDHQLRRVPAERRASL